VPLDAKHSSNALGFSPNLTKKDKSMMKMSGRALAISQGFYVNANGQKSANGQESELESAMGLK
jgi:hypothetical protein